MVNCPVFHSPWIQHWAPEWLLLFGVCILLLLERSRPSTSRVFQWVSIAAVVLALLTQWGRPMHEYAPMALIDLLALFSLACCDRYLDGIEIPILGKFPRAEFYALALLSLIGMHIMVVAKNMLLMFLGLELLSLPLYAMIAMPRKDLSAEAAFKYFVLGGVASAVLLYGMSLIYAVTGTLDLGKVHSATSLSYLLNPSILFLAWVMCASALAFKLGLVPFHLWLADVYSAAPMPVVLWLSGAPKIAALAMMIRLFFDAWPAPIAVQQLPSMLQQVPSQVWLALGLVSVLWGNIMALAQVQLRRLLAYSTVAHMGYVGVGFAFALAQQSAGLSGALVPVVTYVASYSLLSVLAFGLLSWFSEKGACLETLDDLKGLASRSRPAAVWMLWVLCSFAGIPPTLGFFAKYQIFQSLLGADWNGVAIFLALMTVVSMGYYLRLIALMFFEPSETLVPASLEPNLSLGSVATLSLVLLTLSLLPGLVFVYVGGWA